MTTPDRMDQLLQLSKANAYTLEELTRRGQCLEKWITAAVSASGSLGFEETWAVMSTQVNMYLRDFFHTDAGRPLPTLGKSAKLWLFEQPLIGDLTYRWFVVLQNADSAMLAPKNLVEITRRIPSLPRSGAEFDANFVAYLEREKLIERFVVVSSSALV